MSAINDHYVRYYLNHDACISRHVTIEQIASHSWGAALPIEQTAIHCMQNGFALCIAMPAIRRIWDRWDADYLAHCEAEALLEINNGC